MRHARSQVGSRLAVASSAKISRPRPPPGCTAGAFLRFSRNWSTSAECASVGSRFLPSLILPSRRAEPHRGIVKHHTAVRQARVGARQEIDADTLFESMIGPQLLDDHHPFLQSVERSCTPVDALLDSNPGAAPGRRRGRLNALDLEHTGAGAIVRADAGNDIERQGPPPADLSGRAYHTSPPEGGYPLGQRTALAFG